MIFWIFQISVDFLFLVLATSWFRTRRTVKTLEILVDRHQRVLEDRITQNLVSPIKNAGTGETHEVQVALAPMIGSGSVLSEKSVVGTRDDRLPRQASIADAYDRAEEFIRAGLPIVEVAKRSGLSVSELQLFEKLSIKNQ